MREEALNAGAVAFLLKPLGDQVLLDAVRQAAGDPDEHEAGNLN
jgi:FixJ family two-component response regulator